MSDIYRNALEKLDLFFNIENSSNAENIFLALKEIIDYKSAYIFFLTPMSVRKAYSYNSCLDEEEYEISEKLKNELYSPSQISMNDLNAVLHLPANFMAEKLKIKNNIYGFILITGEFSEEEKKIFKTCASIISALIKDIELSKIMQMQTKALQEGILEKAEAYKTIKSQNKKILASEKVKNQFLANVSHELRTPLNSIIGFSELLQNQALGSLNEKQESFVKDIQTSSIMLLGMINEILDISKLEAHSMKFCPSEFDIAQNINEVLNIIKPLNEKKNIKIVKNFENFNLAADYQKIQQILFNLLSNAIKFTPENGSICVKARKLNKYCEITVKDSGCGIAKENQKRIFKKFEQINQFENSTGLGLAITKKLVKMHNGKINVISEIGKGSEFIVKIPVCDS